MNSMRGAAMLPFLALASVSGLHTLAVIGSGMLQNWGVWGTMIALGAIGALLGYSVYQTIIGDLGYLVHRHYKKSVQRRRLLEE